MAPRECTALRSLPLLLLPLAILFGCTLPRLGAQESVPREIEQLLRAYEAAWEAGDPEAVAALFTEDGFVSSPAGWVRGRQAIAGRYANAGGALRLTVLAFEGEGAVGYVIGEYSYDDGPGAGRFLLALRRVTGEGWRIAADLDATNVNQGGTDGW